MYAYTSFRRFIFGIQKLMKFNLIFSFLLLLIVCTGCNEITVKNRKTEKAIKTDGLLTEWNFADFTQIDEIKTNIGFLQDSSSLYFAAIICDKSIAAQAMNGLTFSVSLAGNKQKDIEIWLRPKNRNEDFVNQGGFFTALSAGQKERFARNMDSLAKGVFVKNNLNNKMRIFTENDGNIFVEKANFKNDTLFVEIRIPISMSRYFKNTSDINSKSMFCIEASGSHRRMSPPAGGPMNGGRQMSGMEFNRERGMSQREFANADSKEFKEIWIKCHEQ